MAVSAIALQAQADELARVCPVLMPSIAPRKHDLRDLAELAHSEGPDGAKALQELLAGAAASCRSCYVCSAPGQATTSASRADDGEAAVLRFSACSTLDIPQRTVRVHRGGFSCGRCRALQDTLALVHCCSAVGSAPDEPHRRSGVLLDLAAHLAQVNSLASSSLVVSAIADNPDALAAWLQEIVCQAYALKVVASSIAGWAVVGPDGGAIKAGAPGAAAALAKQLLALHGSGAKKGKSAGGGSSVQQGKAGGGSAIKQGKRGKHQPAAREEEGENGAASQEEQVGRKRQRLLTTPAAAPAPAGKQQKPQQAAGTPAMPSAQRRQQQDTAGSPQAAGPSVAPKPLKTPATLPAKKRVAANLPKTPATLPAKQKSRG